jgi:ribokinase
MVTVLRANEHEAEALTGIRVTNRSTAQTAAAHLLNQFGLRAAIVVAGHGNLAVWRESAPASGARRSLPSTPVRATYLPRLRVEAVDATGAGDAFAAALAVSLAEGQALPNAAHFANAAAALATTKLGAQPALPKRAAALALLRRDRAGAGSGFRK